MAREFFAQKFEIFGKSVSEETEVFAQGYLSPAADAVTNSTRSFAEGYLSPTADVVTDLTYLVAIYGIEPLLNTVYDTEYCVFPVFIPANYCFDVNGNESFSIDVGIYGGEYYFNRQSGKKGFSPCLGSKKIKKIFPKYADLSFCASIDTEGVGGGLNTKILNFGRKYEKKTNWNTIGNEIRERADLFIKEFEPSVPLGKPNDSIIWRNRLELLDIIDKVSR